MENNHNSEDRIVAHLLHWIVPGLGHLKYLKDPQWHLWLIFTLIGLAFFIFPGVVVAVLGHIDLAVKMGTIEGKPIIDSLPKEK